MMKKNKWLILLIFLVTIGLAGCSYSKQKTSTNSGNTKSLSGVYKYTPIDSTLSAFPKYYYFKKDGTVYIIQEQNPTAGEYAGKRFYSDAMKGNWKYTDNKYSMNVKSSRNKKYSKIRVIIKDKSLIVENSDNDGSKESLKQSSLSSANFMEFYKQAKKNDASVDDDNAKIITADGDLSNSNNDSSSSANSDSSSTSADPDEIGKAVYARVFPSEQVDSVEQDGDSYYVSNEYHSADSTVEFQINGDKVTYWTQADGDTTADGKNDAHTVSIKDLLGN